MSKKMLEKWQAWVAIVIGLLTIVGLIFDLPGKIKKAFAPDNKKQEVQTLSGIIWNESREPLAGVTVRLPEFDMTDTTNQDGEFEFKVKATRGRSVNLIARKEEYEIHDTDATLGDTAFNFTMRKKDTTMVDTQVVQTLSGIIWGEDHEPLAGVTVRLSEFDMTATTNQDGEFEFKVKAKKQQSVNLIARKEGYETYDTDATLGNTAFSFTMRRKK